MKLYLLVCLFSLIGLAMCEEDLYPRGCIYALGRCIRQCEEGTHSYTTGCGHLTPEATCDEPNPIQDTRGMICDYSACYCDPPTVRDTVLDKCVLPENCSKKDPSQAAASADKEGRV